MSFILIVGLVLGSQKHKDLEITKGQDHEHLSCEKCYKYALIDLKILRSLAPKMLASGVSLASQ